jgi:hypothetical protein
MSDGISFFSNDDVEQHVQKVITQTNYTADEAREKLKLFNCDYMKVIKDYMGIPEQNKSPKFTSVNQEIYRQIRQKLDTSMREYRERNPINMEQVIENFKESDEREQIKNKIR